MTIATDLGELNGDGGSSKADTVHLSVSSLMAGERGEQFFLGGGVSRWQGRTIHVDGPMNSLLRRAGLHIR